MNDNNWKDDLIAVTQALQEDGVDLSQDHAVYEWQYAETPGVVYTIFIGPSVIEGLEPDTLN